VAYLVFTIHWHVLYSSHEQEMVQILYFCKQFVLLLHCLLVVAGKGWEMVTNIIHIQHLAIMQAASPISW
jgi:hypothetical protein